MSDFDEKETIKTINEQIANNHILLYMKGTPSTPQCGFSAHSVSALKECGEKFSFVNILENPDIRATLPKVHDWPTFPQLYVKGELIGGCDIILEMAETGELQDCINTTK